MPHEQGWREDEDGCGEGWRKTLIKKEEMALECFEINHNKNVSQSSLERDAHFLIFLLFLWRRRIRFLAHLSRMMFRY